MDQKKCYWLTWEITCSNEFPLSQYLLWLDVSLEISVLYHIFILIRMVPCPLHFRSFISLFLSLSIEFSFTLVKRIRIFVMLNPLVSKFNLISDVYNTRRVRYRSPFHDSLKLNNHEGLTFLNFSLRNLSNMPLNLFWLKYALFILI